jgi:hypothetical protein
MDFFTHTGIDGLYSLIDESVDLFFIVSRTKEVNIVSLSQTSRPTPLNSLSN